mmetsp:Transcript_22650/g.52405  ORF Transcript_22650/g.52405 Transcript_22650/m.52405 type:complete len:246 (-) Transcript_22650:220-957(-)
MLVDVHEQVPVARARVHDVLRLGGKVLPGENSVHVPHKILEERRVLGPATNDVQGALHMDLTIIAILPHVREAPARLLEQDVLELGHQWRVRSWHVVGIAPLQRQRATGRQGDNTLRIHGSHAQLLKNLTQGSSRDAVDSAKIELLHGLVLAIVQPLLAPPSEVRDRRQQRGKNHTVEEDGQNLALRPGPARPVFCPHDEAVRGRLGRQAEGRDGLRVDAAERLCQSGGRPEHSQQLVQLFAGHC